MVERVNGFPWWGVHLNRNHLVRTYEANVSKIDLFVHLSLWLRRKIGSAKRIEVKIVKLVYFIYFQYLELLYEQIVSKI